VDIGSGDGEFIALCHHLGYQDITAVDFRAMEKFREITKIFPTIHATDLSGNIGDHFANINETYDVIHMSHVIEHIPKYGLFYAMDGVFKALKIGGALIIRTPNMGAPAALSSLYVTLAHEYGFTGSNLKSLLDICGFDNIQFHTARPASVRQFFGAVVRAPFLFAQHIKHRLFGHNVGGQFSGELNVTAQRGTYEPLYDPRFR
jgi:hypothetical protein